MCCDPTVKNDVVDADVGDDPKHVVVVVDSYYGCCCCCYCC